MADDQYSALTQEEIDAINKKAMLSDIVGGVGQAFANQHSAGEYFLGQPRSNIDIPSTDVDKLQKRAMLQKYLKESRDPTSEMSRHAQATYSNKIDSAKGIIPEDKWPLLDKMKEGVSNLSYFDLKDKQESFNPLQEMTKFEIGKTYQNMANDRAYGTASMTNAANYAKFTAEQKAEDARQKAKLAADEARQKADLASKGGLSKDEIKAQAERQKADLDYKRLKDAEEQKLAREKLAADLKARQAKKNGTGLKGLPVSVRGELTSLKTGLQAIDEIGSLVDIIDPGTVGGARNKVKSFFGLEKENVANARLKMNTNRSAIIHSIAGSSMTPEEKKMAMELVPTESDNPESFRGKATGLKQILQRKYDNLQESYSKDYDLSAFGETGLKKTEPQKQKSNLHKIDASKLKTKAELDALEKALKAQLGK